MTTSSLDAQLEELLSEDAASAIERESSTFDEIIGPFQQRIVLFGAGNLGRKALRALRTHHIEPLAFSDNAAALWGTEIDGVKVLSPNDAAKQYGDSAVFFITIFSPGSSFRATTPQLLGLSCVKVVSFLSLLWKYPLECLPHMLVDLPHRILRQKGDVWKAYTLLDDDTSRREYVAQVQWRLRQDFDVLPPPMIQEQQYFPDDLFTLRVGEFFVDCGAFDGDTIRAIIKRRTDFGRIVAFEPDPSTFERLEKCLSELRDDVREKISAHRLGIGATKGTVRFEAAGSLGSKISDQGEIEVECDVLDEFLDGSTPTYVKMDIEGAELDALRGAEKIMQQNATIWAVCVYHKPNDLWRVPLLIASHCKDHHFFLRKYEGEMWESVCYAVPSARLSARP